MLPKLEYPTFSIEMPSTKQKLSIRPMRVKEEKILLMAKESNENNEIFSAIKQIVSACMSGSKVEELTLFDLEWVYLKIRSVSISNIIKVSYKDSEDEKIYDLTIDLEKDVIVKFPDPPVSNEIQIKNNVILKLKYPASDLWDKNFDNIPKTEIFDEMIIACIEKISENGVPLDMALLKTEMLKDWINELSVPVYDQIKTYFASLPSLYCELKYTNTNGKERKIILSSLNDFFPFQ